MYAFAVTKEEITRWTADLVAIPSYPGIPNQEAAVAEYIKSVFDAEGVECRIDRLEDGRARVFLSGEKKKNGKCEILLADVR